MITVTGKIEDATGAPIHATIDFVSKSTPLVGSGIVTTNTDATIRSNPSDGTFSVLLAAGNYQATVSANGQVSTFNIAVPTGTATTSIETLVTTPLIYPFIAPNQLWNGTAANLIFQPLAPPPEPTSTEISYAGGNVDTGTNHYAYWISYVTTNGETQTSPMLPVSYGTGTPNPNMATRVFLQPNQPSVVSVHIWRTSFDNGHSYDISAFPHNVGLLATVSPSAAYYDDWESMANFSARVTGQVPPLYNTTAGQLFSNNGTSAAFVTDNGLFFPGCNCRVKPGFGVQIYNFTTSLWHTLTVSGNPPQIGLDAGNPN